MAKKGKRNVKQGLVDKKDQEQLKKVNEWKSEKKTKAFERLQAISRHPDYKKEYEKLKELDGSLPEIRLLQSCAEQYKEFDFSYVINSEEYKKGMADIGKRVKENETEIIRLRVNMLTKWGVKDLPCLRFPGGVIEPQRQYRDQPSVMQIDSPMREIPNPMKSGELYVKIDLDRTLTEIKKDLTEIIAGYRKRIRTRAQEASVFKFYDIHTLGGVTLPEIARRESKRKGDVNSDTVLEARYKLVVRAYQKAKSMIRKEGDRAEYRAKKFKINLDA